MCIVVIEYSIPTLFATLKCLPEILDVKPFNLVHLTLARLLSLKIIVFQKLLKIDEMGPTGMYLDGHASLLRKYRIVKSISLPGPNPIKILKRKYYAMEFFKHFDWLVKFFNQLEYLKICLA